MRRFLLATAFAVSSLTFVSVAPAAGEECTNVPQPASGPCGTVLREVNDAHDTIDCLIRFLTLNPC